MLSYEEPIDQLLYGNSYYKQSFVLVLQRHKIVSIIIDAFNLVSFLKP